MPSSPKKCSPFNIHFFHGFLGSPSDWGSVTSQLPSFTHTFSHLPEQADFPDNSILVGYSMGGRAALEAYFAAPSKVAGLILLSSNLGLRSRKERIQRQQEEERWIEHMTVKGMPAFIDWWYELPIFRSFKAHNNFQSIAQQRKTLSSDVAIDQLRTYSISRTTNYWEKLSEITIPIFFLFGENDTKYSAIYKKCGSMQKRFIPSSGHVLHIENPQACSAYINQFIEVHYG